MSLLEKNVQQKKQIGLLSKHCCYKSSNFHTKKKK